MARCTSASLKKMSPTKEAANKITMLDGFEVSLGTDCIRFDFYHAN